MARARSGKTGQRVLMSMGAVGVLGAGALGLVSSQHIAKVAPGTKVAGMDVSGLTSSEAASKIQAWFKDAQAKPLKLSSDYLNTQPDGLTAAELGASIDLEGTLAKLPLEGFWEDAQRRLGMLPVKSHRVTPVLAFDAKKIDELGQFVEENMKAGRPARAFWRGGSVVRQSEIPGMEVAKEKLSVAVGQAMLSGEETELPMELAEKRVSDEDLAKITEPMGRYATNFNSGQRERSSNIRLAASIIDGTILLPGETFSFNKYVGRRTSDGGFKRAGVFINGRKDYDIGGGICQVSTTLYNAALLSDLTIVSRSPHSRPVPYVPIGRDAAVSYPNPDLALKNNTDHPVAITAQVSGGRIEFRVLGQDVKGRSISIVAGRVSTSGNGEQVVEDSSLGYGQTKVIESGSSRRSVSTWRVVTQDGREVRRESLGTSFYRGAPRIVARNSRAVKPAPETAAPEGISPEGGVAPSAAPQPSRPAAAPSGSGSQDPASPGGNS